MCVAAPYGGCYNRGAANRLLGTNSRMILSDRSIKEELAQGRIVIEPLDEDCIQPASVDVRLDRQIRTFPPPEHYSLLDVRTDLDKITDLQEIPDPHPFVLEPGQFVLASTIETVRIPDDIVARIEGKSSLGRLGLLVHATAGYVDPGFQGQLTLELSNVAKARITLFYGMRIGQLSFLRLTTAAERPYGSPELGSKYQGQTGPTPSRTDQEFVPRRRATRHYPDGPTELKRWLEASEFAGSVAKLSRFLGVEYKTAQDWVYGRNQPGRENRAKLYEVTRLPAFAPEEDGRQAALFPADEAEAVTDPMFHTDP